MTIRILVAVLLLAPAAAEAGHALCRAAGLEAARRHGVPPALMLAIGEVESSRRGRGAWPWTLNVAGDGAWYDTRRDALAAAEAALGRGVRSIDLGCFQVNRRWHGAAFDGLDEMLDPLANADYAARFLAALKAETGDWLTAAGWYHSRTPKHATRYRRLVARAKQRLSNGELLLAAHQTMPVLRRSTAPNGSGHTAMVGSLFVRAETGAAAGSGGGVRLLALTPAKPLFER